MIAVSKNNLQNKNILKKVTTGEMMQSKYETSWNEGCSQEF